jgi:hypothetical protein
MLAASICFAGYGGALPHGGALPAAGSAFGVYCVGCIGQQRCSFKATAGAALLAAMLAFWASNHSGGAATAAATIGAIAGAQYTRAHSDGRWFNLDGRPWSRRFFLLVIVVLGLGQVIYVMTMSLALLGAVAGIMEQAGGAAGGGFGGYDFRGYFNRWVDDTQGEYLEDPYDALGIGACALLRRRWRWRRRGARACSC